jgi:hypothetical protein
LKLESLNAMMQMSVYVIELENMDWKVMFELWCNMRKWKILNLHCDYKKFKLLFHLLLILFDANFICSHKSFFSSWHVIWKVFFKLSIKTKEKNPKQWQENLHGIIEKPLIERLVQF